MSALTLGSAGHQWTPAGPPCSSIVPFASACMLNLAILKFLLCTRQKPQQELAWGAGGVRHGLPGLSDTGSIEGKGGSVQRRGQAIEEWA